MSARCVYNVHPEQRGEFNRRGFYHPTAIIILALITLSFAVIFFINSEYFQPKKSPSPAPSASPQLSPSPKSSVDSTTNWKTYTAQDKQYSFRYPPTWDLHTGQGFVEVYCSTQDSIPKSKTECNPIYNVNSITISELVYKSIDEFVSKSGDQYTDKRATTVGGKDAMEFVYPGSKQSGGSQLVWVAKNKDTLYQITYIYPNLLEAKTFQEFSVSNPEILSTFQFLN